MFRPSRTLGSQYDYTYLLGMSKKEILTVLGEGFNFFPDNVWVYILKKTWLGQKVVLFLVFEDGYVKDIEIKRTWK
ncbi:hypothetical protein MUU74_08065 [Chryseobacterium daecheongense]|uniref:hypothetical protein n=1 Tax=Chryseobacterium daecheongense TaxID=192389 RepID=UPI001FD6B9A7|nr:hypothetical protein [Chryseobacterium daecheongense]UOU99896.1 hypothetical protein MUU74_08065 [Chryseobacterium daecheongense]